MSDDKKFVVLGAEVKCDCGSEASFLKTSKKSMIGNKYVMLDTHTDKIKNFSNTFGMCKALMNKDKPCNMNFLQTWFGPKDDIVYKNLASKKKIEEYYSELTAYQKDMSIIMDSIKSGILDEDDLRKLETLGVNISATNIKIDSFGDANNDIKNLETYGTEVTALMGKMLSPQNTDIETIKAKLKNAQSHLETAQTLFDELSESYKPLGSQLIETSVLVCKNGGVVYIQTNGQHPQNEEFLHGFTKDLQYIYLQGYKYKVYVPPQPQKTIFAEMTKSWVHLHSDAVTHMGFDVKKFIPLGESSDYKLPSQGLAVDNLSFGETEYTNLFEDIFSNAQGPNENIANINISPTGEVVGGKNQVQRDNQTATALHNTYYGERSINIPGIGTVKTSAAKVDVAATIVSSVVLAFASLKDRVDDCLVRYDVYFDFFIKDGERIVVMRWYDYQLNRYMSSLGGKYFALTDPADDLSFPKIDARFQKIAASQQVVEDVLIDNGFLKLPKSEPERELFKKENVGKEEWFLPEYEHTQKTRHRHFPEYPVYGKWYGYNSQLLLSKNHSNSDELGYLHFNSAKKLLSTMIMYDNDVATFGWGRLDNSIAASSSYKPLLDYRFLFYNEVAFPIYHFFVYNWGNVVSHPEAALIKERIYENPDDFVIPTVGV